MSASGNTSVNVPPPPREIPRWFFVRRMQGRLFAGALMASIGLGTLVALVIWSGHPPPGPDWSLDRRHKTAEGRITDVVFMPHYHHGSRSPYRVRFTFGTEQSRPINAVGYTFDASFALKRAGDVIPIEYDPSDPRVARPTGGWHSLFPWWTYALAGIGLVPGLFVLIILDVQVRRERALLATGEAVEGEVTGVRAYPYVHFGRRHPYDIDYAFRDARGTPHTGRDRTYLYAWARSLRERDLLIVIHDPIDPARNALWLEQPGRADRG